MNAILMTILLAATTALTPSKGWYAPNQPLNVEVKTGGGEAVMVLTDFGGKVKEAKGTAALAGDKTVNLKEIFPDVEQPGTYLLYLVKKGGEKDLSGPPTDFIGTPLVIGVRHDSRQNAPPGPMVTRVEPLRYAVMKTAAGSMTMAFYYDVAPNTTANFLKLSEEGFYDGLTFHRIVPGFVIQGGDPRGDGTGSPGYMITAEFNLRPHKEGVLSMARSGDPAERSGAMPRPEFANSASSQFFVCLDYNGTKQLDGKYTAFGEVTDGMDVVKKIGAAELADPTQGKPRDPQVIEKVEVKSVTSAENPYAKLFKDK